MECEAFVPGLELARRFHHEAVAPILDREFPKLQYAAGLLGAGSDVVGYDTARSMDHDWGPRCLLFLRDEDLDAFKPLIDAALKRELPREFVGFATGVGFHPDGATRPATADEPFQHRITITTPRDSLRWHIGINSLAELNPAVWVTTPQQKLLEFTAGAIFRDDTGEITRLREESAWYPDDVWRYLLAGFWKNIAQLEPFVGRCGEVDDDLGSQLVAMRIVRDQMHLAFLQERRYAPYQKWFGTAFSRLAIAPELRPHLDRARYATSWQEREAGIVAGSRLLAERHNRMELTPMLDKTPRPFYNRPFQVLDAERFTRALADSITDPEVRALPRDLGGLDTWVDSTDAVGSQELHRAIRGWMTASPVEVPGQS
ncbi:MAG: DUF4037 domain-containing protein [Thermomicrobiales bacterium]